MSTPEWPEQKCGDTRQYHQQIAGEIVAHLRAQGLSKANMTAGDGWSSMSETRGQDHQVTKAFEDVMQWMIDEKLIRVTNVNSPPSGNKTFLGVYLTSKALNIIRRTPAGEDGQTIETKVEEAKSDSSLFSKIGELVGSAAGGFAKSNTSG